ncbi:MAG TPA: hypothetical protein VGR37_06845 [Longimicrobiaceae bacterium]|nr:hypothetical protein [Longimicrobiaceae bacterium]
MEHPVARGPNFVYGKQFVLDAYGRDTWNRVLARMPDPAAGVWKGIFLATEVYPFSAFKAMATALAQETGMRNDAELARMYSFIADQSLNRIYKVFFRLANPSFVIGNYPKLWTRFFAAGQVEVPESGREHATVVFTLPEMFLDWLPPACLGFSTKAVEMAGGRELTQQQRGKTRVAAGEWQITFDLRWRE